MGDFRLTCGRGLVQKVLGLALKIEGRLTRETYRDILETTMLPTVRQHFPNNEFIFQQDNCPVHTARVVANWFQENQINVSTGMALKES